MPKLRRLSGLQAVAIFQGFGFVVVSQRGSHIKLRRLSPSGERQNLVVPNHRELDTGTCRAVLRQASRYIAMDQLAPHFFAE